MATTVSINRAGKVRAQTPVVPKADKPKKKTGRAALRLKYQTRVEKGYFEAKGKIKFNAAAIKK